ncbi:hypothetical protein C8R43DRAFT_962671 [Mycena crocata]|nr:hypothetical protein C8R43DRAFT_962671 [Mycena crocata]
MDPQRLCKEEKHALLSLTFAIARYDLTEKDITAGLIEDMTTICQIYRIAAYETRHEYVDKINTAVLQTSLPTSDPRRRVCSEATESPSQNTATARTNAHASAAGQLATAAAVILKHIQPLPKKHKPPCRRRRDGQRLARRAIILTEYQILIKPDCASVMANLSTAAQASVSETVNPRRSRRGLEGVAMEAEAGDVASGEVTKKRVYIIVRRRVKGYGSRTKFLFITTSQGNW